MTTTEGRKSIILVDDETIILLLLERVLTEDGYNVSTATNVEQGYAAFASQGCDLLITDFKMHDGNGIQLVQKCFNRKRIPVILITGNVAEAEQEAKRVFGEGSGNILFMQKPIDILNLRKTLKNLLGSV